MEGKKEKRQQDKVERNIGGKVRQIKREGGKKEGVKSRNGDGGREKEG